MAVTADVFGRSHEYYRSQGFHDYISKPFKAGEIYNALKKLLGVEFIYEEDEVTPVKSTSIEKLELSQITIPEDLCVRMLKSAELNCLTEIEKDLEELGQNNRVSKQFLEHLKQLWVNFDIEAICKILRSVSTTKT